MLVGVLLPLLAVGGYLMIGNPQVFSPLATIQPGNVTPEQIQAMVGKLAERVKSNPDNIEDWLMLGRSYKSLGRTAEAAEAYSKVEAAMSDDPDFLADYADLLAMMSGGKLDGKPLQLIKQALELDSKHLISLWLAGTAAFDKREFSSAVVFWERALNTLPPESEERGTLQGSIAEAKRRSGFKSNPAQAVSGRLTLAAAKLANVPTTATVFIFARPTDGTRMPLAVAKVKVADLPYDFVLDDSQAMVADKGISSQSQVIVEARISLTGDAIAREGDLRSNTVQAKVGERKVRLVIQ
jgi:cytochrome c-type biogenesis protein CcmH